MKKTDEQKIVSFYEGLLTKWGDAPQAVDYGNKTTQLVRYKILTEFCDFKGQDLLDVGCGKGDFLGFLKKSGWQGQYTGIELSSKMLCLAQKKYPEARFIQGNFETFSFSQKFDIVLASGTFDFKTRNHFSFLKKVIAKMYDLSKIGATFNLTSVYLDPGYANEYTYYAQPEKIFKYCKTLARYVTLRHDYLPNDFTIYMYKKAKYH